MIVLGVIWGQEHGGGHDGPTTVSEEICFWPQTFPKSAADSMF